MASAGYVGGMRSAVDDVELRRDDAHPRPRVLIVGQASPARGGIPSFVDMLVEDAELRQEARMRLLNTARAEQRPSAASITNLRAAVHDTITVWRAARGMDVVHLHVAPAPILPLLRTVALVAAARVAGARAIVHAHSGRMHIAARSAAYRACFRALIALTDVIVVVSRDGELLVRRLGGEAMLLRNAVDTSHFVPAERDGSDAVALTFVGTVCERKGLDDLRDALVRIREDGVGDRLRVTIVGDARQEGPGVFERVRDAYERSGLTSVTFTGARPPDDVGAILSRSDVFCLPSHWEGLPISVLEAMAAGCAVVATSVGEIPALLGDDAGVVVPPHDPARLAVELRRLIDDPQRRAVIGRVARERVVRGFDRRAVVDEIASLYRRVAGVARP